MRDQTDTHLPAYVSNGVVGLRVRRVPLRAGMATLSGLEGEHPLEGVACVPTVPYPLAGDVAIDGASLSDAWARIQDVEQRYDFAAGELHTRFVWQHDGGAAIVTILTFCARSEPSLCLQEVTVEVDGAADVTVSVGIDWRGVPGRAVQRDVALAGVDPAAIDGAVLWETFGAMATCGAAYMTECNLGDARRRRDEARDKPLTTSYSTRLRKGHRFTVRQMTALVPSAHHNQPARQAIRAVALGRRIGFAGLRKENADSWRDLWKARVVLVGADERWQALADAAFFYVHTSTHPGSLSTHPFGLAQWFGYHYYYGHVMWDIDSFLVPALVLTSPNAASALLAFRTRTLEAAHENARLNGLRGAQFPWEASPARGEEAAPRLGDAAMFEHHVTADVALAFAQYVHATGDEVFAATQAWPVLASAAEWISNRAMRTDRGWEIPRAMGIAERAEPADNAAFVNMTGTMALREALRWADRFGYEPPPRWRAVADGLVLPQNRAGVILDHDGYTRREEKASTPAALAGIFPVGYPVSEAVEKATLRFYLDMADDYVGSPMLSALLGAWAAMLPDRALSARLFEEGYAKFGDDHFNVIREYRADKFPEQPVSGPFLANMGGFLMALLFGLTGLRVSARDPLEWGTRPVVMPDLWDGIEVERLWVRGREASLRVKHGDERAVLEFASSPGRP